MKRLTYIITLLCLPAAVSAQVAKHVEVSKDYTPSVGTAQKLSVIPDMTDTVTMQPDIDYTITPRSYQTSLLTENFRPATITYWDYNRSRPFYAKGALGVPLTSEADVYVSTFNKDRGYAMAYVNHWGDYRNRKNFEGMKVTSHTSEMSNRAGGRAGLFLGRHTLEADIYGDQQLRHRYPTTGARVHYGRIAGKVRIGDDFTDLSRWNFNVEAGGGIFGDGYAPGDSPKRRQSELEARLAVGRMLGKHVLRIHAGYTGVFGAKALDEYKDNMLMAGARYGISGRRLEFLVGADYYHDRVALASGSPHHVFPYLHMTWKNTSEGFVPYIEVDGGLRRHDYGSLKYENPYMQLDEAALPTAFVQPNESYYNGRAGISGRLARGRFSYNLSAEVSFADDHCYWYCCDYANYLFAGAYQQSLRIDGSVKFRPVGQFEAELYAGVYAWENYDSYYSSRPSAQGALKLRYLGRRISAGVSADYHNRIKWMSLAPNGDFEVVRTPATFQLGLNVEWRVNDRWAAFAEGRNLTGSKVYEWAYYYYDTPQFVLGAKITF